MRKYYMIFAMLLCGLLSVTTTSCSDDDKDEPIAYDKIPSVARSFVSKFYPGINVTRVVMESDHGTTEYEVYLANGHDVTFDVSGEWTDVDAPSGQKIPDGIAPLPIVSYVANYYPGDGINEIAKEPYGYEVELISGTELEFDHNGEFLRVS